MRVYAGDVANEDVTPVHPASETDIEHLKDGWTLDVLSEGFADMKIVMYIELQRRSNVERGVF